MTTATAVPVFEAVPLAGLHALVGGSGPPVVLVHGLAGAAANWVDVAPALASRHRVVALDLPGHGGSPAPPRALTAAGYADAVAAALEAAAPVPSLVVGHSFGGLVALHLAARRPELVRALLLVAPAGLATRGHTARAAVAVTTRLRPARSAAVLAGRLGGARWFRRAVFRPWYVSDEAALSDRAVRGFLCQQRLHRDVRTAGRAMGADDAREVLGHVRCPALVLWGARDRQVPLADGYAYARRLRAPLRVVADCGHLLPGERPGAVVDAVGALYTGFATST